jgi:hypothetical protein
MEESLEAGLFSHGATEGGGIEIVGLQVGRDAVVLEQHRPDRIAIELDEGDEDTAWAHGL